MRVKAETLQKALMGGALVAALLWNLAHAAEVRGVNVTQGATGTRAEIELDADAQFQVISLAGPDRLVVDLPASSVRTGARLPAPAGVVKSVRFGQPSPGVARIVFDLAQPVSPLRPHLEPLAVGRRLVIEWPGDGDARTAASASEASVAPPAVGAMVAAMPVSQPGAAAASSAVDAPAASSSVESAAAGNAAAGTGAGIASTLPTTAPAARPSAIATAAPAVSRPAERPPVIGASTQPVQASVTTTPSTPMPPPRATPAAGPAPSPRAVTAAPAANGRRESSVQTPPPPVTAPQKAVRDSSGRPLRSLIIAIDAGHGGQDPGAIGPTGRREKDVTLAIARELARQLNATPGYRAVLTRDADYFIPLNQRGRVAKQAGADMFVSIHADAAENRAAHGSSVYVLSLKGASSQRARWLADKENAADLIGGVKVEPGNTLASVLLDLTQSGNLRASEDAAGQVLAGLARLGRNHKPSVERANFAVLRSSDTPAMLVETAFISNHEEEQRLSDPVHQQAIARAVLGGVTTYFTRQPPPGTLVAAQVEAQTPQFANASAAAGGSP